MTTISPLADPTLVEDRTPQPFPKYPDIALLPRRPEILAVKEVIATEKLHGSNFRVNFPAGMESIADVRFGSRDVEDGDPNIKFPLNNVKAWFTSRPALLQAMWDTVKSYGFSNVTVFGEAYGPGMRTKGVKYSNGQEVLFRAFDIMVEENFLTTWELFCEVADKMGIPRVVELWRGDPTSEAFDRLLEHPSAEARANGINDPNNLAEGVVLRSNPMFRNALGEWLVVKHKGKKFSEVAHAPTVKEPRGETPADTFAATYVTEGRITNAIGRLADRGTPLKGAMADMPALLKEMVADLHKECEPEWTALGLPEKQLTGAVSKVLGPLYRSMLEADKPSEG